jgi:Na+:H+ antiporter, NhaA family
MKIPPRSYGSAKIRARRSFLARRLVLPAQAFLHTEGYSSVALLGAAVVALVWANSPWHASYERLWQTPLAVDAGILAVRMDLRHWINDGLMAIFFYVVGLEIKRELVGGDLSEPRRAALPIVAAVGGMVMPALIYLVLNPHGAASRGWGIPMATDIAFAVGALLVLGDRVPVPLRVFLLALAVVDDMGAIVVIAVFYVKGISLPALALAALLLCVIAAMSRAGIRGTAAYLPVVLLLWVAVFKSGVHATVAGVLLGLTTTSRPWFSLYSLSDSVQKISRRLRGALDLGDFDRAEAMVGQLEELSKGTEPPLERRLRKVHPWSSFVILPLFALANSDVVLSGDALRSAASSPVAWGILLGLCVGKPVGIVAFAWLAVHFRLASLPKTVNWSHVVGASLLAGIGFTVSLFVTELAFDDALWEADAKIGIFAASVLSGVAGYVFLRTLTRSQPATPVAAEAEARSV